MKKTKAALKRKVGARIETQFDPRYEASAEVGSPRAHLTEVSSFLCSRRARFFSPAREGTLTVDQTRAAKQGANHARKQTVLRTAVDCQGSPSSWSLCKFGVTRGDEDKSRLWMRLGKRGGKSERKRGSKRGRDHRPQGVRRQSHKRTRTGVELGFNCFTARHFRSVTQTRRARFYCQTESLVCSNIWRAADWDFQALRVQEEFASGANVVQGGIEFLTTPSMAARLATRRKKIRAKSFYECAQSLNIGLAGIVIPCNGPCVDSFAHIVVMLVGTGVLALRYDSRAAERVSQEFKAKTHFKVPYLKVLQKCREYNSEEYRVYQY
ncbi:hypothetical protein ALC62_12518 [Cyphomyrmex costatus]|uniref:Uncharacterized protein n=1 Tax=Cyphomyrmex costatus TaxID=456900 RepID=A0A195C977_9HYME|nr:hypothetical protein ALC62_12518 [Cyphomyrmex costatus]